MQNYRTHFRTFVERYPVVLSTTHSLCASIGAGHLLDYVIIDESSQVDILTAAVCCACCRNIIIIGDSRQLPHIVEEQLRAKAEELRDKHRVPDAYDYVRQNILSSFKRVFGNGCPSRCCANITAAIRSSSTSATGNITGTSCSS